MEQDNYSELQKITLSALLKDSYLLAKVKQEISIDFFDKSVYKLIYRGLVYYYSKYSKLPICDELILAIKDICDTSLCSMEDVRVVLKNLYILEPGSPDFVTDHITRFIKKRRVENTLTSLLPKIQSNAMSIDELGDKLSESVTLDLHCSRAFRLTDTEVLPEVRRESVGSEDNPTLIRSCIEAVNNSLLYHGYKSGDVAIVVAKPGCFTGDTKIMTNNHSAITLEELYNSHRTDIMTYSAEMDGTPAISTSERAYLSEYTDRLMAIEVDGKHTIRCTLDHPFLLKSGEYVNAENLKEGDELMPMRRRLCSGQMPGQEEVYNAKADCWERMQKEFGQENMPAEKLLGSEGEAVRHLVTKVSLLKLDAPVPVYGLYNVARYHNYTICLGDNVDDGVVVKNCGKTMYMVNELANAARQGYNALHLFVGDMTEYDGLIRYLANITGATQDNIIAMRVEDQVRLIKSLGDDASVLERITVKSYSASEITVEQLIEDVRKIQADMQTHYDIIAVDYPDNLVKDSDSMYESGGDIYNRLSFLARRNHCVVLAGSQPKVSYWNEEIIPLNGCAESSKKQHIADLIIALGRPASDCNLLTGFLAKVRRGTMGNIFRLQTDFSRARIKAISEFDYIQIKAESQNIAK